MKIVADDKIPYIRGVFEPYADITYLPGKAITAKEVKEADALLVRTRTAAMRHCWPVPPSVWSPPQR